jgi:hypothetical protein
MVDWAKIIGVAIGAVLVVFQSFFLSLGLTVIWAVIFSWKIDEPWWSLFGIGLMTDIFYLNPWGKTSLILIAVGLVTKYLKNIFGFRESYKMRVSRF